VGTMTVGLWWKNGEGRSREGDGGRDRSTLVVRQTRDGQLWRGRLVLVSEDERPKGEKGGSEMATGPWLSSSGRAKAKDPGGRWLCLKKNQKWGLRLLWLKREHDGS
jgi:hypothetical protein